MSKRALVVVGKEVTAKVFREVARAEYEERFYHLVPWATPRLIDRLGNTLLLETLPCWRWHPSPDPATPLRRLLRRLHRAGIAHRDLGPSNVLLHPERGPVLVDWELALTNLSVGKYSYDLHGPTKSGVSPPPEHMGQGAQWWGSRKVGSIGRFLASMQNGPA